MYSNALKFMDMASIFIIQLIPIPINSLAKNDLTILLSILLYFIAGL